MDESQPSFSFPSLTVLKDEPPVDGLEIDPICGMSVDPRTALTCQKDGKSWYFCCAHCREKFLNPSAAAEPVPEGATYFCPMCPGVVSDHPASCPICGMALEPDLTTVKGGDEDAGQRDLWRRFLLATACTIPVFVLAMGPMVGLPLHRIVSHQVSAILQFVLSLPVVAWCGWPFWVAGARSLVSRQWNMFTLILLGVGAAFGFSVVTLLVGTGHEHGLYFESAAVITTLVLLGQILEGNARRRTGQAMRELMELVPPTAHRIQDGVEVDVSLSQVMTGDVLRVRPGERVPVDGIVLAESEEPAQLQIEGSPSNVPTSSSTVNVVLTTINESMLTGEPMPVAKSGGDAVFGGTVNETGSFRMRADRVGRSTMLSQIVDLVSKAQRSRSPSQRLADEVSNWFVPVVVSVAVISFFAWLTLGPAPGWNHALTNAVAVLIIACPCALGLATPMAITVGMGRGAREGILFRDAESLEQLGRVDRLFVDKTGTLTEGQPTVMGVKPEGPLTADEVLSFAASVEQFSEHPLARAVIKAAIDRDIPLQPVLNFHAIPGMGVSGTVAGSDVSVGISSHEPAASSNDERALMSATVSREGTRIGEIQFSDQIRHTAREGLVDLHALHVDVQILTGDRPAVARQVAEELGIDSSKTHAGLNPGEKLSVLNAARQDGHRVAMAGDGINDAPALAAADAGISLGTGTDIAKQSAGIILIRPDLTGIARAIRLSRRVSENIRQNILFAFAYNAIGIPVAAGILYPFWGLTLNPMFAAAAMSLSSVSVIVNALRLRRVTIK